MKRNREGKERGLEKEKKGCRSKIKMSSKEVERKVRRERKYKE